MSRSPFFRPAAFGDPFWADSMRLFDTHFGSTLTEDDFFPSYVLQRRPFGAPRSPLMSHALHEHPLAAATTQQQQQQQQQVVSQGTPAGAMTSCPGSDKYQIMVDVSHFTPDEISVKMVDNTIVVTGKHEDKADNYGYVSRQFSRKYLLPSDVEPETVSSILSADGILTISAPRKPLMIKDNEAGRSVPIAMSNQILSPGVGLGAPQFPVAPVAPPQATSIPVENVQQTAAAAPEQSQAAP